MNSQVISAGGRLSGQSFKNRNIIKHWFLNNVAFDNEVWRLLNEENVKTVSIQSSVDDENMISVLIEYGNGKLFKKNLLKRSDFQLPPVEGEKTE